MLRYVHIESSNNFHKFLFYLAAIMFDTENTLTKKKT
jgi:hypothetical protein